MLLLRLFWNGRERRLRVFVRLVAQAVLALALGLLPILLVAEPLTALHRRGHFLASLAKEPYDRVINMVVGPLVTVGVLASVVLAARFIDRRRPAELGLAPRGAAGELALGAALGAALMAGVFACEYAFGWARPLRLFEVRVAGVSLGMALAFTAVKALCVAPMEEAVSRGYHIVNLAEAFERRLGRGRALGLAAVVSSIVFALLHGGTANLSPLSLLGLFVNGLLLAAGFLFSGRLALSIGLHAAWNFTQGAVFGFPVSGDLEGASLLSPTVTGPVLLTGGTYGPEGGLIGMASMVVGIAAIAAWSRLRHGRVAFHVALRRATVRG